MSDSVGKISLDLEVKSDLGKQISAMSGLIAKNLKSSLSTGTKTMFDSVKNSANDSVKSVDSSIKSTLNKMRNNLKNTMKSVFSSINNVKLPSFKIPDNSVPVKSVNIPKANVNRGPPVEEIKSNISSTEKELDNVNNKIEFLNNKLAQLKESLNSTFNQNRKMKIQEQILKTEGNIVSLIAKSDKLGFKLADLDSKLGQIGNESVKTSNKINSLKNNTEKVNGTTKKLSNSTKSTKNALSSYNNGILGSIKMMFKWMIILPMVVKGLTAMAKGLYNNLMTNEQFSNSLAQIKSNLMIAFTPIYNAILPAINALMNALSIATQYIASFISAIFGKTFNQSKQATQGLIDAKQAMGAYGNAAKKTGKDIKDSLGLASFDEINSLNSQSDTGADETGGAESSGVPELVTPELDTGKVDSSVKSLVDKIKSYFDTFNFSPLLNSFSNLKSSIEPIIVTIGGVLKWFLTDVLDPIARWTISDLLPVFINLLAGAFNFLNPLILAFKPSAEWLWNNFLQPIASWSGGAIVSILEGLGNILSNIGNWMLNNMSTVENIATAITGFFIAWEVTKLLSFIQVSGGIIGALAAIGKAILATTLLKMADKLETMALTLMYAKDFVVSLANATVGLVKLGAQLIWETGLKIASAVATGVMTVATGIWNGVCVIATTVTWALGAAIAFLTSPIGLVILAITALIAIGVLLYKHWDVVKAKAIEVWDFIKNKFVEFSAWMDSIFLTDWSKQFGFLGNVMNGLLVPVRSVWENVKKIFKGVVDFIEGAFSNDWSRAFKGLVSIFGGIMGGMAEVMKLPLNAVIGLINGAIAGLNKISVSIPDWVPGSLGGKTFGVNIPNIPYLAKGGIIDSPTLAMVGEAGKEAVVPLENNTGWKDEIGSMVANAVLSAMQLSGGSSNNNSNSGDIYLQVDGTTLARVMNPHLAKENKRLGNKMIIKTT